MTREKSDPVVVTRCPDNCARCSNEYVPYTCPAPLSMMVNGVPDCATKMPDTCQPVSALRAIQEFIVTAGVLYVRLRTPLLVRSNPDGPYACLGFVWSLVKSHNS